VTNHAKSFLCNVFSTFDDVKRSIVIAATAAFATGGYDEHTE
jgi:hypothetical protein